MISNLNNKDTKFHQRNLEDSPNYNSQVFLSNYQMTQCLQFFMQLVL